MGWIRSKNFEKGADYNKTWKASEDGKINTNGPRIVVDDRNGAGPAGGYITRLVFIFFVCAALIIHFYFVSLKFFVFYWKMWENDIYDAWWSFFKS